MIRTVPAAGRKGGRYPFFNHPNYSNSLGTDFEGVQKGPRPSSINSKPGFFWFKRWFLALHPWNLTWNLKRSPWKRRFLLETIIFRFHVKFRGCKCSYFSYFKIKMSQDFFLLGTSTLTTIPLAHNMISSTKWRLLRSDKHLQVLEEIQLQRSVLASRCWRGTLLVGKSGDLERFWRFWRLTKYQGTGPYHIPPNGRSSTQKCQKGRGYIAYIC